MDKRNKTELFQCISVMTDDDDDNGIKCFDVVACINEMGGNWKFEAGKTELHSVSQSVWIFSLK